MKKLLLLFIPILISCQPKQQAIHYGHDECHYCRMMIMDKQYGSELVSKTSKVYKFDSVECLINFLQQDDFDEKETALIMVTPYDEPGVLMEAKNCYFLHSKGLPSPMGMYLTAFKSKDTAVATQKKLGGEIMSWKALYSGFKSLK